MSDEMAGVPASGAGAFYDLIAADPPAEIRTAWSDLLDQALAAPRVHRTRTEVWVEEPGTLTGGRWEVVD